MEIPLIDESRILDIYQLCRNLPEPERAGQIAAFLTSPLSAEKMGLGDRDRLFWSLHEQLAGPEVEGKTECAACGEWMEFSIGADFEYPQPLSETVCVEYDGISHEVRLPIVSDLQANGINHGEFPVKNLSPDAPWSEQEFRAVASAQIEAADPGLEVTFALDCPSCEASIETRLDPFAFFWSALRERAISVIDDIVALAANFGWSECDCLKMSAERRSIYLDRIGTSQ